MSVTDTIEAEGHLIDSGLLSAIFDKIIEVKGSYEIITFDIGKTKDDKSRIQMRVTVNDEATLDDLFVHHGDLPGGAAKRDEPELQPESRGFGEGRYALRAERCVQNISDASGSLASVW